jgi:hypothetical protein
MRLRWLVQVASRLNACSAPGGPGPGTATRAQVYEKARQANPLRWSRQVRDGSYVDTVHLNRDTPENKEPGTIQKAP